MRQFVKDGAVDNLSPIFLINNYIHTTEGLGLLVQRNTWIPAFQAESQRTCLLTAPRSHKCPSGHMVYSYIKKVI
jgi:hypothetical protein